MALDNSQVIATIQRNARLIAENHAMQCSGPGCPESLAGLTHTRGSRVFDTATGQEGRIIVGATATTQVQSAKR